MKKLVATICIIAVACCCFYFGNNSYHKNSVQAPIESNVVSNSEQTNNNDEDDIDSAFVSLDLVKVYKNEEEKIADDTLSIVTGKVIKTDVIFTQDVYTCCTVKITETLKGNFDTDEILVLELGGYLTPEEAQKFVSKDGSKLSKGLTVNYSGYKTASVGDEVVLYLYKCVPSEQIYSVVDGERAYHIAGAIQGKMTKTSGKFVSDTPTNIAAKTSLSTADLKEKIIESKR
ncbi:MAG: hypothetical protein J6K64_08150 [Clostridia bacterium]|nr:hypothetical protein [Clostridia bacterium]